MQLTKKEETSSKRYA